MRILAVGDIHGSFGALTALMDHMRPGSEDQLIFLGDYVDRGEDSCGVLAWLVRNPHLREPIFLRGNHEEMMLEAREDPLKSQLWQSCGGLETLFSYDAQYCDDWPSQIPRSHWSFLERTRPYFETSSHIFVHGFVDAELDLKEQPEVLLYWETFDRIQPHKSGKRIICGHTAQHSGQIKDLGFATCIDTASATGGWLTCLDPDSGHYWQANEIGKTRSGKLDR